MTPLLLYVLKGFPSAFEAICLLPSWSFMSGDVSLEGKSQEMFGVGFIAVSSFMALLGMCEGWEEVQRKNQRSFFNSSTRTTSLWRITICPSAPTANI